jgi:hypothetical protein
MYNDLKNNNNNKGYYYINEYEDENSISAVVPNGAFLKIVPDFNYINHYNIQ